MSKPMTVARYAKEHRGWFYGCLLLFALVAFLDFFEINVEKISNFR